MKFFAVFTNYLCDDPYYGYNEYLLSIYEKFEQAQKKANELIAEQHDTFNGIDGYVTVVEMLMGNSIRTELFSNIKPRPKKKVAIKENPTVFLNATNTFSK